MIKLIVSDMDGTLLDGNSKLPKDFLKLYDDLKRKGITFTVASGRQYLNLRKFFKEIDDEIFFIAENGTCAFYKNELIYCKEVNKDKISEVIEVARTIEESYVILCSPHKAYTESNDEIIINKMNYYFENYEVVEDLTVVDDCIVKIAICDFKGSENNSINYFKNYENDFKIGASSEFWLEITEKGANKGETIKFIQERINLNINETMVFGDYLNDMEMMDRAYYSYAMANGHKELKKRARFEAKSNLENGVIDKIKEVILNNDTL